MVFPVCRVWPNPTATGPGTGGVSDGERLRKTLYGLMELIMFILSFSSIIW